MSFSSEVKRELSKSGTRPVEKAKAEAYGLVLFCRSFSPEEIYFRTESEAAAERFSRVLSEAAGAETLISETLTARKNNSTVYRAEIDDKSECCRVFSYFGHEPGETQLRIKMSNIEFDACAPAFLRGAFLTCGSVTDPETEYRLEFNTVHKNLSNDLCGVISETTKFTVGRAASPKITNRRGSYIVYLKDSDDIADLLALMGAGNASMKLMEVKIRKSCQNDRNRKNNSVIANTEKTVLAAVSQVKAIKALEESGMLGGLSEELQSAAKLRIDNPTLSLSELCRLSNEPVSRSGLNHRLKRLEELAEKRGRM